MSYDPQHTHHAQTFGVTATRDEIDAGLRAYMLRVYNYMALGVAFTGIVALVVASSPALMLPSGKHAHELSRKVEAGVALRGPSL